VGTRSCRYAIAATSDRDRAPSFARMLEMCRSTFPEASSNQYRRWSAEPNVADDRATA
jgi:hypothetical protein